jgi:TPR repeat protein
MRNFAFARPFALAFTALLLAACAGPNHAEMQATFDAGLTQYDAGNFKGAYDTWRKIEDVDLAALRNVALMLRKGEGVKKDPEAARQKMERAADMGLVTAQADLGEMVLNGEGGKPDPAGAVPWLGRAAAAGHPIAALELGEIFEAGNGAPKDLEAARRLYEIAAKTGSQEATARLKALPPPPPSNSPATPDKSGH